MERLLTFILLLGFCGLKGTAQTGHLFASDKLSSTNMTSICQDQMGYIWIGTEFGLNRFDGYRFTSYLNNPQDTTSLGFNTVVSLLCDSEGRLWVGCQQKGLFLIPNRKHFGQSSREFIDKGEGGRGK